MSHFTTYMDEAYRSAPRWKRWLFKHAPHPIARRVKLWNRADIDRAHARDRADERRPVTS